MIRGYAPHRAFVAPAQLRAALPLVVVGYALIEAIFYAANRCFEMLLAAIGAVIGPDDLVESYNWGDTALGLLLQLFSFGFLGAAVVFVAWIQHHRHGWTLFGARDGAMRTFLRVSAACCAILIAIEFLPPHYDLSGGWIDPVHLALVPLSLVAILVQTSAEELLYRGYLQQQFAARFDNPLIWMVATNLMFAVAHLDLEAAPAAAFQYVAWTFCFGLAASDLTARTGSLAAAIGFHFVNNAYAFLFWAEQDTADSGLALLMFPPWEGHDGIAGQMPWIDLYFLNELGIPLVLWLAARVVLRR